MAYDVKKVKNVIQSFRLAFQSMQYLWSAPMDDNRSIIRYFLEI